MKFRLPDTFEELQKIFAKTDATAPRDLANYLEEPLHKMVLRLGNSLLRLEQLTAQCGPQASMAANLIEALIQNEQEQSLKYHLVMKMRGAEFISKVQDEARDALITKEEILENLALFCKQLTQAHNAKSSAED